MPTSWELWSDFIIENLLGEILNFREGGEVGPQRSVPLTIKCIPFIANEPCDESCSGGLCVVISGVKTCDCNQGYSKQSSPLDPCLGEYMYSFSKETI